MAIELAGITLEKIHRMETLEKADFASHRIPGLDGNVVQNMGRNSVRLLIEGIFYGEEAAEDLESLRDIYKAKEEVDFLAEIVGQAYFSQVILEQFEVKQAAGDPEQYSYKLILAEFVPPPEPAGLGGLEAPEVDTDLELEALDFMDMVQLPDLLSVPGFGDPTEPLTQMLEGLKGTLSGLTDSANVLGDLFADE